MERRRATRRTIASDEPLAHAKLRTGGQLVVLEASSWGALTETPERLLPGRHLDVHIVTPSGRTLVRSRVARAFVCHLQPDAIHYRVALAFDQPVDTHPRGYLVPPVLDSLPIPQGKPYPERHHDTDIEFNERLSA